MSIIDRLFRRGTDQADAQAVQTVPTTANEKIREAEESSDWGFKKGLYEAAALQLYEQGGQFDEAAREARVSQLRAFETRDIVNVKIATNGDLACSSCQPLSDRELPLSEALDQMIIPEKKCTYKRSDGGKSGWCRCLYVPVVETIARREEETEEE